MTILWYDPTSPAWAAEPEVCEIWDLHPLLNVTLLCLLQFKIITKLTVLKAVSVLGKTEITMVFP